MSEVVTGKRSFRVRFGALGLLAVAAVFFCSATVAQAAPKSKQLKGASAGPACGGVASAIPGPNNLTMAAATDPFDLRAWLKGKAGEVGTQAARIGFNYLSTITGLDQILPQSDNAKILAELEAINGELTRINQRLDDIGQKVDQAIKESRDQQLSDTLRLVCDKANKAERLYLDHYVPAVQAGVTLGDILSSKQLTLADGSHFTLDPAYADTPIGELPQPVQDLYSNSQLPQCNRSLDLKLQLQCLSPRELVLEREKLFANAIAQDKELAGLDTDISSFLRPGDKLTSVLSAYGLVLMEKRIIGRTDSVALRDLYDQLAQAEALASWMVAEYHVYNNVQLSRDQILARYTKDTAAEVAGLPPMIPQGAVVDLAQVNAANTRNRTIFMLATTQDQDYWPVNVEVNNLVTTTANGAGQAIAALNGNPCSGQPACFTHWKVPTRAQLRILLSEGSKALPGADNPNVARYLARLSPNDPVWTGTFCDRSGPPVNPDAPVSCAPAPQHRFIWTEDQARQRMACGFYVPFLTSEFARFYWLRFGIETQSNNLNTAAKLFPQLPSTVPGYTNDGQNGGDKAHTRCDNYTRAQIALPENKGIVLAIDNTGSTEFMAQP
jgi:hypothetical protein